MRVLTMLGMVLLCAACQLEEREAQPHALAANDLEEACVPPEYEYLRFKLEKQHAGKTGAEAGHKIEFNIRVRKDQLANCDFSEIKVCLVANSKSEVVEMSSNYGSTDKMLGNIIQGDPEDYPPRYTDSYYTARGVSSRDAAGRYDKWKITCYENGGIRSVEAKFGYDASVSPNTTYIYGTVGDEAMDYSQYHFNSAYSYTSAEIQHDPQGEMLTPQQDNNCFPESPSACRTPQADGN